MRTRVLGAVAVLAVLLATAVGFAELRGAGVADAGAEAGGGAGRAPGDRLLDPSLPALPAPGALLAPSAPGPRVGADAGAGKRLDDDLVRRLDEAVDGSGPAGELGVAVLDEQGGVRYRRDAADPLLPASTQKLVTAAAALAALGPDFRYTTRLAATAAPGPDGVVDGQLVLIGDGDPALATPTFGTVVPERPRTPLEALADQLIDAGITGVTGGVVGDPHVLADQPAAPGWLPRYFDELDATRVSGLTVEAGRQLFVARGRLQGRAADDPAVEAAASLTVLLRDRGVNVVGEPSASRNPPAAPVALASVSSPPLSDLLQYAVQRSDNHIADAVFRTLGRLDGGAATWAAADAAARRALAPLDLDLGGARLADGSGLSRDNRLSPAVLATLDTLMSASELGVQWRDLMAVSGQSGTLRRRLVGTIVADSLRGKTGSLDDVRALAGAVVGPDGRALHLAVISNGLDETTLATARRVQDAVVLVLVAELYDCDLAPADQQPTPPPEPLPAPPLPVYNCPE